MRDDAISVGAIAIIAMCVATAAHEAFGHGGACLLLGGHITLLTSVYFHCDLASRFISPAGPLGNLVAGFLGWAAMRLLPVTWPRAKLFALLLMAFSFFWAFAYLVSSLATGNGDYAITARDFFGSQYVAWRGIGVGALLYLVFARALSATAGKMLGDRATRVLQISWVAATVTAVAAAALYAPERSNAMLQGALEIGAASIPLLIPRHRASGAGEMPPVARSISWIAAAAVIFASFAFTLGAGYAS